MTVSRANAYEAKLTFPLLIISSLLPAFIIGAGENFGDTSSPLHVNGQGTDGANDNVSDNIQNITQTTIDKDELDERLPKEVDHFFLLIMSIIIFFMQCGFAFMEAGAVR